MVQQLSPRRKIDELMDQVIDYANTCSCNDIQSAKLEREVRKLMSLDPAEANLLLGVICETKSDITQAFRHFENAIRIKKEPWFYFNYSQCAMFEAAATNIYIDSAFQGLELTPKEQVNDYRDYLEAYLVSLILSGRFDKFNDLSDDDYLLKTAKNNERCRSLLNQGNFALSYFNDKNFPVLGAAIFFDSLKSILKKVNYRRQTINFSISCIEDELFFVLKIELPPHIIAQMNMEYCDFLVMSDSIPQNLDILTVAFESALNS